jgi:hypothetical protein
VAYEKTDDIRTLAMAITPWQGFLFCLNMKTLFVYNWVQIFNGQILTVPTVKNEPRIVVPIDGWVQTSEGPFVCFTEPKFAIEHWFSQQNLTIHENLTLKFFDFYATSNQLLACFYATPWREPLRQNRITWQFRRLGPRLENLPTGAVLIEKLAFQSVVYPVAVENRIWPARIAVPWATPSLTIYGNTYPLPLAFGPSDKYYLQRIAYAWPNIARKIEQAYAMEERFFRHWPDIKFEESHYLAEEFNRKHGFPCFLCPPEH